MKVRDVLTAEPQMLAQIHDEADSNVAPWDYGRTRASVRFDLDDLVASGFAVRVSLPEGYGWRLAGHEPIVAPVFGGCGVKVPRGS